MLDSVASRHTWLIQLCRVFNGGLIVDLPFSKAMDAASAATGVGPPALLKRQESQIMCIAAARHEEH